MIWTEEQKSDMQRMREEGLSNADIGQRFGISGDRVRKVLARYNASETETRELAATADPEMREPDIDSLRRLHDEFDAKVPGRSSSRPKWAGRAPLRITPKGFPK